MERRWPHRQPLAIFTIYQHNPPIFPLRVEKFEAGTERFELHAKITCESDWLSGEAGEEGGSDLGKPP